MRYLFLGTFLIGALASPLVEQLQESAQNKAKFCDTVEARAANVLAASAYCSAFLNVPRVTIKKTIDYVTKTVTRTTSTKTYLAYPVTSKVAQTITLDGKVYGTSTKTITTSVSTTTIFSPMRSCPVARQDCRKKGHAAPPELESRPACLSSYVSPKSLRKACSCLDISTYTTTKTITEAGAPTSTITVKAAGKKTRTITKTRTTATITVTPTYGATVTTSVAAIETLTLNGPYKLASGPDYRLSPANGWAYANGNNVDSAAGFGGDSDCISSYFALSGTQLLTQYFNGSDEFPDYSLVGNVMKRSIDQGADQVFFTSPKHAGSDRVPLSCAFAPSTDVANVHAACPLTCSYAGAKGNKGTLGANGAWYIGQEVQDHESFTLYAYQYGGPSP